MFSVSLGGPWSPTKSQSEDWIVNQPVPKLVYELGFTVLGHLQSPRTLLPVDALILGYPGVLCILNCSSQRSCYAIPDQLGLVNVGHIWGWQHFDMYFDDLWCNWMMSNYCPLTARNGWSLAIRGIGNLGLQPLAWSPSFSSPTASPFRSWHPVSETCLGRSTWWLGGVWVSVCRYLTCKYTESVRWIWCYWFTCDHSAPTLCIVTVTCCLPWLLCICFLNVWCIYPYIQSNVPQSVVVCKHFFGKIPKQSESLHVVVRPVSVRRLFTPQWKRTMEILRATSGPAVRSAKVRCWEFHIWILAYLGSGTGDGCRGKGCCWPTRWVQESWEPAAKTNHKESQR